MGVIYYYYIYKRQNINSSLKTVFYSNSYAKFFSPRLASKTSVMLFIELLQFYSVFNPGNADKVKQFWA